MKSLFSKFKKPHAPKGSISIGVDIGRRYIKLISLVKGDKDIVVDKFSLKKSAGDIAHVLRQMIKENSIVSDGVNISLSGKSTIVRDLWLPIMSEKELKASLGYELDQYVPFPVEDIYYDSCILKENPMTRKEKLMRVVLAVANKKFVDENIKCLRQAGLSANIIDMDAIVLFNLFEREIDGKATVSLVDIGSTKTIIDIISDCTLTFTREIEYGAAKAMESVSRGLSISIDEAEKLMCEGDSKVILWLQDLISKLGKELWNSFEYYEGQEQRPVEKVYITGGGGLFPEIINLLGQSIGLPVFLWRAADKFKIDFDEQKKKEFEKISPLFSIAAGAACRSL